MITRRWFNGRAKGNRKKTINILGDTQREQWHSVVNMLRLLGGSLTYESRDELCNELDRYIDHAEDIFDKYEKLKEESEEK